MIMYLKLLLLTGLGTDGRDRMIKKLLIIKGSDVSNQDEVFTHLHTQLVR